MIIPYEIETLLDEPPRANWILIGVTTAVFLLTLITHEESGIVDALILDGWGPIGIMGHLFLHGDLMHLLGNMWFLWVFGNGVCSNAGARFFLTSYFICGVFAAVTHLFFDGDRAVGASGAINGIIGVTLAAYPFNRVSFAWVFFFRWGTFQVKIWHAVVYWLLFDLYGVVGDRFSTHDGVAYWAHLGGLGCGILIGLVSLHQGWLQLTEWDNQSLLEQFRGDSGDERKAAAKAERLRSEQEEEV
jgi:membrane associated rhomboid family serine protease